MNHTPTTTGEGAAPGLRRGLNIWQVIAVSVALMAPAMAANINPQGTASVVGRAVPLAFALATLGALLIAYSFVRLTQRFQHAGSVYGFVGASIGPRAGIFSGWLLGSAYVLFAVYTAIAAGRFIADEVATTGLWTEEPLWMGFVFAGLAMLVMLYYATRAVQGGTKFLLAVEGVTVLLILIVAAVVLGKLLTDSAPAGQQVDLSVFSPSADTGLSNVFLGVVFGFLSFAGFEGAATLGEETTHPRRDVPRAVLGTVIFGGLFFIIVTAIEVMGFGTSAEGVAAFTASPSLMGDLGSSYVGSWIGHVITIGAAISAVSCGTACTVGSSRLIFALSRDGAGPAPLAALTATNQVPARAVGAILGAAAAFLAIGWAISSGDPFAVAIVAGTAGTLILLVAYLMATFGTIRLLFWRAQATVAKWEVIIPLAGIAVLGYTIWRNLYPLPVGAAWWGPGLFLAVLIGLAIFVAARADLARRAGERLTADEGLSPTPNATTSPVQ